MVPALFIPVSISIRVTRSCSQPPMFFCWTSAMRMRSDHAGYHPSARLSLLSTIVHYMTCLRFRLKTASSYPSSRLSRCMCACPPTPPEVFEIMFMTLCGNKHNAGVGTSSPPKSTPPRTAMTRSSCCTTGALLAPTATAAAFSCYFEGTAVFLCRSPTSASKRCA